MGLGGLGRGGEALDHPEDGCVGGFCGDVLEGHPGEGVGFFAYGEAFVIGVGGEEVADVEVEVGGIGFSGGDFVDVEIEDVIGGEGEVEKAGLFSCFAKGGGTGIGEAIAVAAGLDPDAELFVVGEEGALVGCVEDEGGAGDVAGDEVVAGEGCVTGLGEEIEEAGGGFRVSGVAAEVVFEWGAHGLGFEGDALGLAIFFEHALDVLDAGLGERVGAHEFGAAAASGGFFEGAHHADHCGGIVASFYEEGEADGIGFGFVITAEFGGDDFIGHLGGLLDAVAAGSAVHEGHGEGLEERLEETAFHHLLIGVAADDVADFVADFVAEDSGDFGFVFEHFEEAGGEEDLAAGEGEGVYGGVVGEEVKFVLVGGIGDAGVRVYEFHADSIDEGLGVFIGVEAAELLCHLVATLEAEGDFLLGGVFNFLSLAGVGVELAGAHEVADTGEGDEAEDEDHSAFDAAAASAADLST